MLKTPSPCEALTLGQEPACCDVIQQRVPAVSFQNAQAPLNCIVSPKTFRLQSMKAEESARKSVFSYGRFSSLFCTLCHEGGTPKGSRGRPGTALGRGVARWCHFCSFLVTFLDTFWHPWGPGGSPGRTRGLPLATFCTSLVGPWSTNGAKSCEKCGFVDFAKMTVFPW